MIFVHQFLSVLIFVLRFLSILISVRCLSVLLFVLNSVSLVFEGLLGSVLWWLPLVHLLFLGWLRRVWNSGYYRRMAQRKVRFFSISFCSF